MMVIQRTISCGIYFGSPDDFRSTIHVYSYIFSAFVMTQVRYLKGTNIYVGQAKKIWDVERFPKKPSSPVGGNGVRGTKCGQEATNGPPPAF